MTILTVQPREIVRLLERGQIVYPDDKLIESIREDDRVYLRSYQWMSSKMIEHGVRGRNTQYPFWGWERYDDKEGITMLRSSEWDISGYGYDNKELCIIELSLSDSDVLLSDFDMWHFVLSDEYLNVFMDDKMYNEHEEWYKGLPDSEKERVRRMSWNSIFETSMVNQYTDNHFIQGTFWCIKPSDVVSIIRTT